MLNRNKMRARGRLGALTFALVLVLASATLAAIPPGYYDAVDTSTPSTLRASLHAVIQAGQVKIPYTSSSTDTWDVLNLADEDPLNPADIIDVYKNTSYVKISGGTGAYNREHTWPNSYGFPNDVSTNLCYTDCHALMLSDASYNSSRNNNYYDTCASACTAYPAATYNGESGTNYRNGSVSWETWIGRRGDVARALLYLDVRYEGDGLEPDLVLTDDPGLIQVTGGNASVAYMGLLSTLLQWHLQDPVNDRERHRNDVVYAYQHNRNPFIDHPEWVQAVFQGYISGVGNVPVAGASISSIYPNPFNPNTNISIRLGDDGPTRVEVFSVGGQLVRVLLNDSSTAGEHTLRWDGTNEQGGPVASGAYFCRVESGAGSDTKPLLLLK